MYSINLLPGTTVGTDLLVRLDSVTGETVVWDRVKNSWTKIAELHESKFNAVQKALEALV